MLNQDERAALRAYIERKLPEARRQQRIGHLVGSLIMALTMLSVTWALTLSKAIEDELWIAAMLMTIALVVSVSLHALSVFQEKLGEAALRRRIAVQYPLEKALQEADVDELFEEKAEKPKRERYRLTDDGEIVPDQETEDDLQARRARSG